MAVLRKLSAKLRTAISISPTSSPESSPTATRPVSSFGLIASRKEGGIAVARSDHHMRSASLMTYATNTSSASRETVGDGERREKPRRMSRFREELDVEVEVWGQ